MRKKWIRNVFWIALIAVWSFWAGAYFNLGWVRSHSVPFSTSFIIGGVGMWIVFTGMGILVYRLAKKGAHEDPAKPALGLVSFFTVCFLIIALIKYGDVQKDQFVKELEYSFVRHYATKASEQSIEIKELERELVNMYVSIQFELRRDDQLDQLMELKTADAVFEKNRTIAELCLDWINLSEKLGDPPVAGMRELFE